jgi:hypothetical protein
MSKMKKYTRKLRKKLDKKKSTYKIWDVVCVVLIATICNCNDWEEIHLFAEEHSEWLRNFLQLTGGIPTDI